MMSIRLAKATPVASARKSTDLTRSKADAPLTRAGQNAPPLVDFGHNLSAWLSPSNRGYGGGSTLPRNPRSRVTTPCTGAGYIRIRLKIDSEIERTRNMI